MEKSSHSTLQNSERRHRLHELVIALIRQQDEIELLDAEAPSFNGSQGFYAVGEDPGRWLERNRRIIRKYQSLVRSAITLDALIDSEHFEAGRNTQGSEF